MEKENNFRAEQLFYIKILEESECYEEMMTEIKNLIIHILNNSDHPFPTYEERALLSVAYKNVIASYKTAYRVAQSVRSKLETNNELHYVELTDKFMKPLQDKCTEISLEVVGIIDEILKLPDQPIEDYIYYWKQKGDLYRNISQVDSNNLECKDKALECVEISTKFLNQLSILNPVRLGMLLSQSVFKYDVLGEREQAIALAQSTFTQAMNEMQAMIDFDGGEDIIDEAMLQLQLLKDNLSEWTKGPDEV